MTLEETEIQIIRAIDNEFAQPPDAVDVWKRLDERPPTAALVLLPDHVRDIDLFVRRYRARPYGPMFFFPDDVPKSKLERLDGDTKLPGGQVALCDGRGRHFHLSRRYAANF